MKVNPLLKHSIALALCSSGLMASGQAWGATCSGYNGNWDTAATWLNCNSGNIPALNDSVVIVIK